MLVSHEECHLTPLVFADPLRDARDGILHCRLDSQLEKTDNKTGKRCLKTLLYRRWFVRWPSVQLYNEGIAAVTVLIFAITPGRVLN